MNVKVLYCASTTSHLKNFHLPYFKWLSENGCEVVTLTDDGQKLPHTSRSEKVRFTKKLWSLWNIKAIIEVWRMLRKEKYTFIVVNTSLAAAVVRLAVILLQKNQRPKVLRIAHGLECREKERIRKWTFLFPDLICAKVTDIFAVMNLEQERIALKYNLGRQIILTHGMGVDAKIFCQSRLPDHEDFKFVYAARFVLGKNHIALIRAFAKTVHRMPAARLVLAGDGVTFAECKLLANRLGIAQQVDFLGYVKNIPKLLAECDVAVSSSLYEGLPFNIMEAMACGLPIIANDIAGHNDLLEKDSLYQTERELEDKLVKQYNLGKRRIVYQNLKVYALDNVMGEWTKVFASLITTVKTEYDTGSEGNKQRPAQDQLSTPIRFQEMKE